MKIERPENSKYNIHVTVYWYNNRSDVNFALLSKHTRRAPHARANSSAQRGQAPGPIKRARTYGQPILASAQNSINNS